MNKKVMATWTAAIAALTSAGSLSAHHSLGRFDTATPVWVKGAVGARTNGIPSSAEPSLPYCVSIPFSLAHLMADGTEPPADDDAPGIPPDKRRAEGLEREIIEPCSHLNAAEHRFLELVAKLDLDRHWA